MRMIQHLVLGGLLCACACACASAPPPPPPAPPKPEAPPPPIPREAYLKGYAVCEVREAFAGTAALQAGLHWLVDGALHNRGNREIVWLEVEFHVSTSGKRFRHIVLNPLEGHDSIPAGGSREIAFPVCPLTDGIVGDYDPARSEYPPPQVTAKVTDIRFADEPPPVR